MNKGKHSKEENYGRTLYFINETNGSYYVNMTITRKEKNENLGQASFYVVKYIDIDRYKSYTKYSINSPINADYSSSNNNISVYLGGMHEQKESYVSPTYYIAFYDADKVNNLKKSICSAFTNYYNKTTFKNSTDWSNENNIKFKDIMLIKTRMKNI